MNCLAVKASQHVLVLTASFFLASGQVHAALNSPISFAQAGEVTLTLDESTGGFDHILELSASTGGIATPPLMALTANGDPNASTLVLGFAPANIGDTVNLGPFAANQELVFRLSNVGSARFGNPGEIEGQIFTGSSSPLNPNPADYYTFVDFADSTTIKVIMEDIFSIPSNDPDPANSLLTGGYDVAYTLTLTPAAVPIPAAGWLFASAMAGLFGLGGKRRIVRQ